MIQLEHIFTKCKLILNNLQRAATLQQQNELLSALPVVQSAFADSAPAFRLLREYIVDVSPEVRNVFLSLLACEQQHIFLGIEYIDNKKEALQMLANDLLPTHHFYATLGGIVGYHTKVIGLMVDQLAAHPREKCLYLPPPIIDHVGSSDASVHGIEAMDKMGEIYPVGGAGDRLGLIDARTKRPMPAASLAFCGRSLFEELIRDLQAREYVYYKLYNKQLITPIVLMTSAEKMNDCEIAYILEKADWFGRPKSSFFTLVQPLVPVITITGQWAIEKPLKPLLKPGGHGVIWKLALELGAFKWLLKQGRSHFMVRQINNPLADLDGSLFQLAGYGVQHQMHFGFTVVPRKADAAEGAIVLQEKKVSGVAERTITNLEYTELAKEGLVDIDAPANTNILFGAIDAVEKATKILPIPGMLVNMKLGVKTYKDGSVVTEQGARLESTMQNIADAMGTPLSEPLKTYALLHERRKIMSVTKKSYDGKGNISETPEGAFYDLLAENRRLLKEVCKVSVPSQDSPEEYLKQGPSLLFLYHPALGPLYSIIRQKIRGGQLSHNAELQLEIAHATIHNLDLTGSLLIHAKRIMGFSDPEDEHLIFSETVGRVHLENVQIINAGIDRSLQNCYWKGEIVRKDAFTITLEGDSEFYAKDVVFRGSYDVYVPHGMKAVATGGEIILLPLASSGQ